MPKSRDSRSYCARCKNRATCTRPCYPVECLLASVTNPSVEPPSWYVEYVRGSTSLFDPPPNWEQKTTKEKIFELYFIDHLPVTKVAHMAGCSHPYVSQVVAQVLSLIRK